MSDQKLRFRAVPMLLSTLAGAGLLLAQDFLQKDYRQWSKGECQKVLEDSPWARRLTQGYPIIVPLGQMSPETANELIPEITYIVQLRSALPIRQALVRQQQIEQKYDRMSVEQKQAFDQSASRFLAAVFSDTVIVHVEYSANAPFFAQSLARYWQTASPEALKQAMNMIPPHAEKIPPLRVVVGQGGNHAFEMVFPRSAGGQPLLDPAAKSFAVEFQAPLFETSPVPGGLGGGVRLNRVYTEFKVAKMIVQGHLQY
jgi:hypothetical protein